MSRRSAVYSEARAQQSFSASLPDVTNMPDLPSPANRGRSSEAIARARKEAEKRGFDNGFELGHADGFARGLKEGRERGQANAFREAAVERKEALQQFVTSLDQVKEWFQVAIGEWFETSEQKMTDLAIAAVREILAAELDISRESSLGLVKQALAEVTHSRHARIRLNPFDSAILQNHRTELLSASSSLRDVELVDDPSILGGCVIETDGGLIDATTETKLELLESAIKEAA